MTATSHPEYNGKTEALEVARAFPNEIGGRSILFKGVNTGGIGFTTAEAFASQSPAHLILAGRTPSKVQECIDTLKAQYPGVNYRFLQLDLLRQAAVRSAAAEVLSWAEVPVIDIIFNSAGIMNIPQRTMTEDGVEVHFATNHVGHFLLAGATRVFNVSSGSPTIARMRWSDRNFEKASRDLPEAERPHYGMMRMRGYTDPENMAYIPLEGYNQSKVANVLFGIALTRLVYDKYGILSLAVHLGVIGTELTRSTAPETLQAIDELEAKGVFTLITLGAGAAPSLVAALDPELGPGEMREGKKENYGAFMMDCQISDNAQPHAVSSEEAEKLWKLSEELVKEKFEW